MAENLLLYSSVLRLLLPRLLRMDLTSTKNAYLLFRYMVGLVTCLLLLTPQDS